MADPVAAQSIRTFAKRQQRCAVRLDSTGRTSFERGRGGVGAFTAGPADEYRPKKWWGLYRKRRWGARLPLGPTGHYIEPTGKKIHAPPQSLRGIQKIQRGGGTRSFAPGISSRPTTMGPRSNARVARRGKSAGKSVAGADPNWPGAAKKPPFCRSPNRGGGGPTFLPPWLNSPGGLLWGRRTISRRAADWRGRKKKLVRFAGRERAGGSNRHGCAFFLPWARFSAIVGRGGGPPWAVGRCPPRRPRPRSKIWLASSRRDTTLSAHVVNRRSRALEGGGRG